MLSGLARFFKSKTLDEIINSLNAVPEKDFRKKFDYVCSDLKKLITHVEQIKVALSKIADIHKKEFISLLADHIQFILQNNGDKFATLTKDMSDVTFQFLIASILPKFFKKLTHLCHFYFQMTHSQKNIFNQQLNKTFPSELLIPLDVYYISLHLAELKAVLDQVQTASTLSPSEFFAVIAPHIDKKAMQEFFEANSQYQQPVFLADLLQTKTTTPLSQTWLEPEINSTDRVTTSFSLRI